MYSIVNFLLHIKLSIVFLLRDGTLNTDDAFKYFNSVTVIRGLQMIHQEYVCFLECNKISEEFSLYVIKQNDEVSSSEQLIFNSETFQSIFRFCLCKRESRILHSS